jgi:hypothetical protein
VNDTAPRNPTSSRPPGARHHGGLRPLDRRRIAEWIGDAFAILCVRVSGYSQAEKHLRLGFEAILRQLGTSPLGAITKSPLPPYAPPSATAADLRLIIKALDSCLATFERYSAVLNPSHQRMEVLIRATRRFAEEALHARRRPPERRRRVSPPSVIAEVHSPAVELSQPTEIIMLSQPVIPITLTPGPLVASEPLPPFSRDVAIPPDAGGSAIESTR